MFSYKTDDSVTHSQLIEGWKVKRGLDYYAPALRFNKGKYQFTLRCNNFKLFGQQTDVRPGDGVCLLYRDPSSLRQLTPLSRPS